ncbi:MAG: hypothetical protein ACFNX8_04295, partial [Lancefieldella rimae]
MQREVANVAAFEKFLRVPLDERKAVLPSRIRCSAKHELRFRWIHVELECPDSRSIAVRDAISASYALLREDKYEEFLASVPETLAKLRDLNSKELEVLLPTSYKLLSDEEFVRMSKNDHEIGYAIINAPGLYVVPGINDSAAQLNGNNSAQGGAV